MTTLDLITITLLFTLFSLAIGSLLNVVIYRLPLMMREEWIKEYHEVTKNIPKTITEAAPVNLCWPGSFCPACQTPIKSYHNIPLISYFLLRGRCASCKKTIHWQYSFVEFLTCCLSLLIFWRFGLSLTCLFGLLFVWFLIPAIMIDIKHQLLPDSLTLSLLWLGLIANTQNLFTSLSNAVWSAVLAYLSLWLFIRVFYWLTGKIGMGNGDFKLFAAFGAWFGWTVLPFILFFASCIGLVYGVVFLKITQQSKETPIPFGPFLGIAGLLALFFRQSILTQFWLLMTPLS